MKKQRKFFKTKKAFSILIPIFFILTFFLYAYFKTGFFYPDRIDVEDLKIWEYENGLIKGASEFSLEGNKETCWLLIHGYASTPKDMDELAASINEEFNEFVTVPRLKGHGEVPSKMLDLTIDDWYVQMEKELENLKQQCNQVNVAGLSMGGTIALKLAENHEFNNLYLISPYLRLRYKLWNIVSKEMYINLFADLFIYKRKANVAQINSPQGIREHISYLSVPLVTIKNSFSQIDEIIVNLEKVDNNILIQHAVNDDTIDVDSSKLVYDKISSQNKELITFTRSNHVILRDYDKQEVINNIISFEKQTRQ